MEYLSEYVNEWGEPLHESQKTYTPKEVLDHENAHGNDLHGADAHEFLDEIGHYDSYVIKDIPLKDIEYPDPKETSSKPLFSESDTDEEYAQKYAKLKTPIPPVIVSLDGMESAGKKYKLTRGRHRTRSAFLRGFKTVPAFVPSENSTKVSSPEIEWEEIPNGLHGKVDGREVEILKTDYLYIFRIEGKRPPGNGYGNTRYRTLEHAKKAVEAYFKGRQLGVESVSEESVDMISESTKSLIAKWDAIAKKPNFNRWWLKQGEEVTDDFRNYGADDYPPFHEPFSDSDDEGGDKIRHGEVKTWLKKAYSDLRKNVPKILKSEGSNLILYRCVKADSLDDIDLSKVGTAWGMTRESADCSLVGNRGKEEFIFTALAPLSAVMIDFSLAANLNPFTDEAEIRLKTGHEIEVISITHGDEEQLERPVKANTGYGQGS